MPAQRCAPAGPAMKWIVAHTRRCDKCSNVPSVIALFGIIMQPHLVQLQAAITLADLKSFRAAADVLDMSPSALSRAIAALETRIGVRLFHRTTRSVSLSEAGEQFILRVQPALSEIASAVESANDFRDMPSGTLRINASEGAARIILTPLILEFLRRYPDTKVDLVADGALSDVVKAGFDAGVRFAEAVPQDMIAVPLEKNHSMAVVAAPSYLSGRVRPKTPSDLFDHECIRIRHPSGVLYHWEFLKRSRSLNIDVRGRLTVNSYNLAIDSALAGAGCTYTSQYFVRDHIEQGHLVQLLADWTPPFAGLCLYYPGRRHVPAALRAFIEIVRGKR